MTGVRPGVISSRAVNQYRRRDVVGFLGARYLLDSVVAQSDRWASEVATDLVMRRASPSYFWSHHYKGEAADGTLVSRSIAIPGPLEILAETALLDECSRHHGFQNPSCVYTYRLTGAGDRSGSFVNYSDGLRRRHRDVAASCRGADRRLIVRYVDIKKFYPSIRSGDAKKVWEIHSAPLSSLYKRLGEKLLGDHVVAGGNSSKGLLTGPMLSHMIANLVLRDVDVWGQSLQKVKYFRYVDDITFVGEEVHVSRAERDLAERLSDLGLELHGPEAGKSFTVSAKEWLEGDRDFEDDADDVSWKRLIGDLKAHLIFNPQSATDLQSAFLAEGMRLPVPDYSAAAYERSFVETIASLSKRAWYRLRAHQTDVRSLVEAARRLNVKFRNELVPLIDDVVSGSGYAQKRQIPKARFRAGRLVYIADASSLAQLAEEASKAPDLRLHAEVMKAAVTGDVTTVLKMGTNAVQSVAQPLSAGADKVRCHVKSLGDKELQGLAVLEFHGLRTDVVVNPSAQTQGAQLLRLARESVSVEMMNSTDPFVRELACLVGVGDRRHSVMFERAFDEADEVVLDAVDRMEESIPFGG